MCGGPKAVTTTWAHINDVPKTIMTSPPSCTSPIVTFDIFMPTLCNEEVVADHSTKPVVAMTGKRQNRCR